MNETEETKDGTTEYSWNEPLSTFCEHDLKPLQGDIWLCSKCGSGHWMPGRTEP